MFKVFCKKLNILIFATVLVIGLGITTLSWGAQVAASGESEFDAEEEPNLVFPVISDTQVGGEREELRNFNNAFKQLNSLAPKQDAFVFIGDETEHGYEEEYDDWMSVFNNHIQPQAEQLIGIGNHEYQNNSSVEESKQRFLDKTGMDSLYYNKVINDYNFIMLGEESGYFYSKDQVEWLGKQLNKAEQRDPEKPIFVFLHHGIKDTTYGTDDWYIDDDNQKLLRDTLEQYPQVILMAGHTHYPISDPRSIYQKDYTTVNTGSVAYMWTEPGYLQGEVPETEVSNGLLVEVYDDRVVINRRSFTANDWIGDPWVIETAGNNKEHFKYTNDRDPENPYFEDDATITVNQNETTTSGLNIAFTQATDNLLTHSYKVTAKNQKTGEVENEFKAFSEYYEAQIPDPLELPVDNLQPATTYDISIRAIDAFGNMSKNTLATTASTQVEDVAGMKNLVEQFNKNGEFKNKQTFRALKIHLDAVEHYKKQDKSNKAVKHMKGFKLLVQQQKNDELISEKTYNAFKMNADYLLEKWQ
ncbi:hypothetical protein GCM10011409_22330 [Lentibacillus populi]|uniref:Fibronectin type-III domain-containing protein n=1 Tax=Lentibacillus populi TaxID=1827502 RepID=A0A9W5X5J4_9BACI|nr:metallophosphoesterase [Lentibacillus populi]GGB44296.1 hypothetical protein GCM10011409_22330 [Lentibacillus populi]